MPRAVNSALPGAKSRAGVKGERERRRRETEKASGRMCCLSENIRDERGGPLLQVGDEGQGLVLEAREQYK